jgi:hypothetical protein
MEKMNYQQIIIDLLKTHLNAQKDPDVEAQSILDTTNDHYQLLFIGWQGEKRIYECPIHIDIKAGKIWIQQDFTEVGIARQLLDRGVPKSDIVLGFRSPFMRQLTEFAGGRSL